VLDKPAARWSIRHRVMPTTMGNALLSRYPSLTDEDSPRPGIVHRLDRDTSGLIVVALNPKSRDWLIAQFKSGKVDKTYVALVVGALTGEGCIEGAIGRHPAHRKRMAVLPGGKPAGPLYRTGTPGRFHPDRGAAGDRPHPPDQSALRPHRHPWPGYHLRPKGHVALLEPHLTRHFLHAAKLLSSCPGPGTGVISPLCCRSTCKLH
jgi:hypothetical protein